MKIDFRSIDVAKRLAPLVHGEIASPADQVDRYWEYQARQKEGGIKLPWGKTHGLFEFKPGTLTMLGGYTGHFKSTIAAQMILSAMEQGKTVGLASLELEMPQIMDQLIDIASLNGDRPTREWKEKFLEWTRGKLYVYDRVDAIKPEDGTAFVFACKDLGCDLVCLDALMMMGLEAEDYGAERDFSQTIQAIAKSESLAVLMVHHCRKPAGKDGEDRQPGKYDLMGSSYLTNICNAVITVHHNKPKARAIEEGEEYDDDEACMRLLIAKNRGGPFEGHISLWRHPRSRAFCGSKDRRRRAVEP